MQAHPAAVDAPSPRRISFEEYLIEYDSYEGGRTEWLGGEVGIYAMSNNPQHNEVLDFLAAFFRLYLGITKLGKHVLAGVPMKYSDTLPAREPDIMILLTLHLDRLTDKYVEGVADIAIEVVSPESVERDYADKFIEYEAAGVPEYWLFDPIRENARIYALGDDGRYSLVPLDQAGRLISTLLTGFALDPALLWDDELPDGAELIELVQGMIKK